MQSFVEPVNDDSDPQHINWAGFHLDEPLSWFGRTITYRRCFEALRDFVYDVPARSSFCFVILSEFGESGE